MRIHVGSMNQTKIAAVVDTIALYPELFPDPKVVGIEVQVPEFGHPKSLKETVEGARERARKAFGDCDFSFGLEGGLMKVPYTKTGYMETGVCAVYDGKEYYIGLGPAFEWPEAVRKLILSGKADASKAFKDLALTPHKKLGAVQGGITGVLTKQRITREEFTKYSIIMALIKLDNPEYFKK